MLEIFLRTCARRPTTIVYAILNDWEEFHPHIGKDSAYFLNPYSQNLLDFLMNPSYPGLLKWLPPRFHLVFELH
jgi:hypothetical protein